MEGLLVWFSPSADATLRGVESSLASTFARRARGFAGAKSATLRPIQQLALLERQGAD